ncbi:hypothetical protein WJX82_006751 [Trebouxia sp. C0006]
MPVIARACAERFPSTGLPLSTSLTEESKKTRWDHVGHTFPRMKRTWGQQSSLAPPAAGMSNLSISSSECSVWSADEVQKRVRGASAAATDQQTWHTQAPMTQEDRQLPSGAEAVAQRVGDPEAPAPEPQAAKHSESKFGQAAMHIGCDADEASPIKGQAIEGDSDIEQVGPVGRKPSFRTAKGRAQAGNEALAEELELVTPEQAGQLVHPGRSMVHAARAATADLSAAGWNSLKGRAARRSPVFASSPTKAGPVLQHPSYIEKWRSSRPKEGIWRIDAESPPHQSQLDRLGSHARQIPNMDHVLTAAPRSSVQPSAFSDRVQDDIRAEQATSAYESNEMMVMVNDFVREAHKAAAAKAAIAAEAEAVENEDDDALGALYSQSSDGDDELEEASAMDAAYGSDEVDALEDDTDAMEETSSVVSGDTSGLVAGSSDPSMQAEQQRKSNFDSLIQRLLTCNSDERPGSQASPHVLPLWLQIRDAAVGPKAKKGAMRAHSDAVLVDFINLHLQVLREDIWTLNGFGQPNPTVVYAYMVLLQERNNRMQADKLGYPNCHFLGPDLVDSILTCGSNLGDVGEWQEPLRLQDMGGRRRPGILDCDKLICVVPLLECWRCVGIDLKHQVIRWYDSFLYAEADDEMVEALSSWVQHETMQTLDLSKWEVKSPTDMALPAETNSYDSGVFALLFAEYASRDATIDFTAEQIGASRIKIISDIILKRIHVPRTS